MIKKIILLSFVIGATFLASCGSETPKPEPIEIADFSFSHQGLVNVNIKRFYNVQDRIYAVSDDGLYVNNRDGTWLSAGLTGFELYDIAVINESHFLASTFVNDADGFPNYVLFETVNAGKDWVMLSHQFGDQGNIEPIHALHYHVESSRLFATGPEVLAVSEDLGLTWQKRYGFWSGFATGKPALALNTHHQEVWFGGQGAIENPQLYQVNLNTGEGKLHSELFPAPATIESIRFAPDNTNTLYVTGEGGILRSDNNGSNWQSLLGNVNYRFYFDIAIDLNKPNRLYTAGWDKKFDEPQPLIIEWSDDRGNSWKKFQYSGNANFYGGVRSLLLTKEQDKQILYLGLWKGGVMRVEINI